MKKIEGAILVLLLCGCAAKKPRAQLFIDTALIEKIHLSDCEPTRVGWHCTKVDVTGGGVTPKKPGAKVMDGRKVTAE